MLLVPQIVPQNKVNNAFGNGVREVTLDASLAPKSASAKTGEQVQMQVQNQVQNAPLNAPMQVQMHVQKNVKIAPPKSAMTLEYARPEGDSPYLVLKRNKELIVLGYSVLFSKAPTLFTELCQFSLGHLKQYITDHMPNGMPKNEKLALDHMPNGMPKNEKLASPKSAVRLECIRADEQSPLLILKRNKELLISMSSRVGVLAPTLCMHT